MYVVRLGVAMTALAVIALIWGLQTVSFDGATLVIVGFTRQGITLASDGLSRNDDGTESKHVQKIFPLGRLGAVTFVGRTKVVARKKSIAVSQVDVVEVSQRWLLEHPDVRVKAANDSFNEVIAESLTELFSRYKTDSPPRKKPFLHTILTGYSGSSQVIFTNHFYQPPAQGLPVKVKTDYAEPKPGELWIFATPRVCNELTAGTSDVLRKYKAEPIIELYRKRKRLSQEYKFTLAEFLLVSDVCLRATESEEGRAFDREAVGVGPPNSFAKITPDHGFMWEQQP